MLDKIPFHDPLWEKLDSGNMPPSTQELLKNFSVTMDRKDDVFLELHDRIFDSNTCLSQFYLALPYLIEMACHATTSIACELWATIGGWLSEGVQSYYDDIPEYAIKIYEEWLHYGVDECLKFICQNDLSDCDCLSYLLITPLGMINPTFSYIATSN